MGASLNRGTQIQHGSSLSGCCSPSVFSFDQHEKRHPRKKKHSYTESNNQNRDRFRVRDSPNKVWISALLFLIGFG